MTRRSRFSPIPDEDAARAWLKQASRKFGVPPPVLKMTNRTRSWYGCGTIQLSVRSWTTLTNDWDMKPSLVHEFAHHLIFARPGFNARHGKRFQNALWEVLRWSYQVEADYPWVYEYKTVKAYGTRKLSKLEVRRIKRAVAKVAVAIEEEAK